jgi:hypothetical protein
MTFILLAAISKETPGFHSWHSGKREAEGREKMDKGMGIP